VPKRKSQTKLKAIILAALGALFLLRAPANEETTGRVVRVHDGDTVTLLTADHTEVKVRLQGIDAPESRQPFGSASKKSLSELVFGRDVHLSKTGTDKYGRTLGHLHVGETWVNHEQIARGMAWHYLQYSTDPMLALAEAAARRARRGLWQDKKPEPPWQWRRQPQAKAKGE
jgi:micrococcal nuclease